MDFEPSKKSKGAQGWRLVRWIMFAVAFLFLVASGYHLYQGPLGEVVRTHLEKAQGE